MKKHIDNLLKKIFTRLFGGLNKHVQNLILIIIIFTAWKCGIYFINPERIVNSLSFTTSNKILPYIITAMCIKLIYDIFIDIRNKFRKNNKDDKQAPNK